MYSARADLHVAKALDLLLRDLLRLGRQGRLRDAVLERVEIALVAVVLAELLLDRLELLAKDVLALVFPHLLFDLRVDPLAHLEDLELAGEKAQHLADALLHVDRLEQPRLLLHRRVEVRRHEIGERARRLDRIDERARLARQLGHQLDDLLRDVAQAHRERLGLVVLEPGLLEALHLRLEVRPRLRHLVELDAREPLQDERVVPARVLERLEHARRAPDLVQVLGAGIVGRGILLREDGDDGAREVVHVLDEGDALLAPHVERSDGAREEHRVPDGEHGELVPELERPRPRAWRAAAAFFSDILDPRCPYAFAGARARGNECSYNARGARGYTHAQIEAKHAAGGNATSSPRAPERQALGHARVGASPTRRGAAGSRVWTAGPVSTFG